MEIAFSKKAWRSGEDANIVTLWVASSSTINLEGSIGRAGDMGRAGPAGIKGPSGETGIPGITGTAGRAGEQGAAGKDGEKGDVGLSKNAKLAPSLPGSGMVVAMALFNLISVICVRQVLMSAAKGGSPEEANLGDYAEEWEPEETEDNEQQEEELENQADWDEEEEEGEEGQ